MRVLVFPFLNWKSTIFVCTLLKVFGLLEALYHFFFTVDCSFYCPASKKVPTCVTAKFSSMIGMWNPKSKWLKSEDSYYHLYSGSCCISWNLHGKRVDKPCSNKLLALWILQVFAGGKCFSQIGTCLKEDVMTEPNLKTSHFYCNIQNKMQPYHLDHMKATNDWDVWKPTLEFLSETKKLDIT